MIRLRRTLARALLRHAGGRLRASHPDWARAMAAEAERLPGGDALRWAAGCLAASYRTEPVLEALRYAGLLALGVAAMTLDQWIEDEGVGTCAVLGLVALLLGVLRPTRFVLSGAAVGAVVAGVHVFGALSGIHPPYETGGAHGFLPGLRWLVLLLPAVLAAAAGARLSRLAPL